MRTSLSVVLLLGPLFLATPLLATSKASQPPTSDRDYVSALAAANRFVTAWETQEHEAGLILLTDNAKHLTSEDRLQTFFSPGVATQRAYEIRGGKKLKDGRYSFPVALFEISEGEKHRWTQPRFSRIVVINAGKDDWLIDKLP